MISVFVSPKSGSPVRITVIKRLPTSLSSEHNTASDIEKTYVWFQQTAGMPWTKQPILTIHTSRPDNNFNEIVTLKLYDLITGLLTYRN